MKLKGKNVLVTGADGFIGSHLVEELITLGCNVRAFVYYNSFNSWGWLDTIPEKTLRNIEVVSGDIRDSACVQNSMKDIEVVFHLAALIGIPYSYSAPESYVDTNIKGALNILQSALNQQKIDRVLMTSTSEVYGTARYIPIDESHPKQGQSPYSASKIGADYLSESFFRSFGLPINIVRPFNTFGPRQSMRAVIPTIINQLISGSTNIELGTITPTRDFLYVKDTVKGFVEIAMAETLIGQEVNIATGFEISIQDLANELISQINPEAAIVTDKMRSRPKDSEVERLCGSNKKLIENTGWEQKYSLETGLAETIDWFKNENELKNFKVKKYTV